MSTTDIFSTKMQMISAALRLSITVNSDRTTVQDGDEYIFSVGIKDDDLTKEPNIKAGDKVTIKLPEFLEIEKFPNQLQQYFNWPPEYDKNTHTITLTFEDIKPGAQSLNVQFSITARVNTIGYDGDGQGSIEVGLGKVKKISTNIGLDTGAGEGSEQGEPYLVKSIWSNGRPNGERYIMKETDKPIGYSVGFGVNSGNGAVITFADDMSSGTLALCSVNGDTSAPLENCITRVTINGSAVLPTKVENGRLVFSHEKLGTMTISKQGKGFKAEITTKAEEQSEFVEVGIRYFAVIVGDAVNATNTATLTIGGEESYNDNATIIRYESQGAVVWKRALDNGNEVTVIDITETDSITFRIKINQYGEGSLYKDGAVIAFDDLEPCLTYDQTAESSIRGPFRIEVNNNRLNIVKSGNDPIPAGEYNIDFRVKVDKKQLDYGNATTNTVGNTVIIRRKAKLTIDKTWAGGKQIGEGAEFSLLDGKKVIASAQSKEKGQVTLYISADDLKSGQHTYVLKETVDENSEYSSVKDKDVVITKADNTITINSIDGQNNASGEAQVSITNTPDSGLGTVSFKKLGEGKEQIGGGTFQLWKKNEGSDDWITDFSTVNGSWTSSPIEYGIYYVKEISAPQGYILGSNPSAEITIKKTAAHGTITMTNEKYTSGAITIKKVDEKNNPLAGAEFMLSGPKAEKKTTDNSGVAEFTGLEAGKYYIIEKTAPKGYGRYDGTVTVEIKADGTATVDDLPKGISFAGETVTLTWTNTRDKGSISITKTGSANKSLQGAVFGLYKDAAAAEKPIDTQQTDKNGEALFADLEAGTYYVKEIAAPNGYALDTTVRGFTIGGDNAWDVKTEIKNTLKEYSLTLVKKGDDGKLLEGVEFEISGNGISKIATSGQGGVVKFEGLPFGRYTITETKAPQGYVKAKPINVTIDEKNTVGAYTPNQAVDGGTITNEHTVLTVLKIDDADKKRLAGATFRIKNSAGQYVSAENGKFKAFVSDEGGASVFETGEDGKFTLEYLPVGNNYELEEISAPQGYIKVKGTTSFNIVKAQETVSVGNSLIKGTLKLVKKDQHGKLLNGIEFVLKKGGQYVTANGGNSRYTYTGLANNKEAATKLKTDENGRMEISGLLWGTYYLEEVNTPAGLIAGEDIVVSVTDQSPKPIIDLEVTNKLNTGSLSFTKTDGAGKGLAGAVFKLKLVEKSGTAYSTVKQMYAISDDEGRVSFEDVPYGVYELTEVIAPEGYVRSNETYNETYYVSIGGATADGITIGNAPDPWTNSRTKKEFTVEKVSADGGEPLNGAAFQVLDEDENPIKDKTITTWNGGSDTVTLPLGRYYLKETVAPEGYELNKELIPFEVTTNGRNTVTVKNTPKTGSLTIQKADKDDKPLLGAEFKIYAAKDKARENPICTLITDSSGKAIKTGIPYGSYVAIESRAPEGYERDNTEHTFDIPQKNEDGTVTEVEDVTISVTNVKSRYALRIVKVDKDNSEIRLAGARFAVSGGSFYIEAVTGEDGTVTVEVPEKGKYLITELEPPAGYTIDPKTYTVEVKAHSADDVNIAAIHKSQDHQTRVELTKVNEKGQQLEGAEFSILDAEGKQAVKFKKEGSVYTYSEDGGVTAITAGNADIVGLPVGDYILRENKAPANYVSLEDIRFHVRADMYDKALELTVENLPHEKGIAVLKESPDGTRLKGAEFALYKADNTEVEKVTTDKAGVALFTGLKSGSYYIKETAAPEGYKPLDNKFEFTIDEKGNLQGDGFSGEGLYTLTVKNSPLEHGFKVKKVSTNDEGLTLLGAEFRILGGGLDKRYTTKADGLTEQITLPIGEYTLTEMKAPEGYVINGAGRHISVRADGIYLDGGKLDEGAAITIRNAPVNFKLRLVKVDADTNQPLANVAFILKGKYGGTHSLITGSDGITDTISLAPGEYTLSEVAAADGYAIPLNGWGFTVTEDTVQRVTNTSEVTEWSFNRGLLTLTLKNSRIYGGLTIEKTDGKDGSALAGAEFTISGSDGTPLTFIKNNGRYEAATGEGASSTIATDANGKAYITGLKFGNYAVTETKAPEGYVLKGDRHSIAISRQQTEVTLRLKNDKAMYKITAIKQDAGENGKLLVGAEFMLYSMEGAVVAKAVTGYDGTAVFEVPEGKYKLVETRAPAGYQLSGDFVREITVNAVRGAVGEFKYTFNNEKTSYSIEIHKHDSEDKQKKLAGAEFAVTDSRGFTKTVTTDASGKASITELPYDDYTIREIKAPKGYALSDKEYSVKKTELVHGSPVVIEAANKYILGSVTIKKVDHENPEKLLEGAKFNVTDENGSLLMWKAEGDVYTLDERGSSVITAGRVTLKDLPEGTYTLTEIDAPSGYAILDGSRTFTITEANMTAPLEIKVENLLRRTAVGFIKVDKNNKELRLAGAEFTLYRMNGEKQGEVVATGVTNSNGLVTFTELTMGSYRAKETKAPKGYKLWNAPIDFTVDEYGKVSVGSTELKPEGLVYTAMITNTAEEKEITLKKVSDTGEALTGATFRLSGEKSYILTTGSDGTAKISLPYGDYILEEVIAPDGYVLSSEKQALNLSDSGLKLNGKAVSGFTVTLKNQPVTFALTLHKRDASTGKALSGATFRITGNSYTKTVTADALGNTETIKLRPGTYGITETATPSGYIRPLGGWTLTVERDGDMSVSGNGAYISLGNTVVLTVDNISNQPCATPTPAPCSTPGSGGTPNKPSGGGGKTNSIGKTGELGGDIRLLCGAAMMLLSFTGLLALLIADGRKKQKYMIGM